MDRLSREQRSRLMARVRCANTGPEMLVRRLVWKLGFRYRLHARDLPGKPDLVFRRSRRVIFVHGCFWHGHRCRWGRLPKSRDAYWRPKIEATRRRDLVQAKALRRAGWSVMVVWQCQLKQISILEHRIRRFLDG